MTSNRSDFISYARQILTHDQVVAYAKQYDDVDMTALIGADPSNFPFLVRGEAEEFDIHFWRRSCGIDKHREEDPVVHYATVRFMLDHAYPVFESMEEAQKYATEHNWPRGPFPTDDSPKA